MQKFGLNALLMEWKIMTSILTNNGAMVALQTLKGINANLAKTQDEISTGKSVASAKDNAAVWATSKVMEADVSGFKAISSGLSQAAGAVGTARQGAEKVTEMLTTMRDTILSAKNASSPDSRAKLQADIEGMRDQIASVVKSSQVNGLNLLDGSGDLSVLSSVDRSGTSVSTSSINVSGQNLSTGGYTAKAAFVAADNSDPDSPVAGGAGVSAAGDSVAQTLTAGDGTGITIAINAGETFVAGDSISIMVGDKRASYTVRDTDLVGENTPADMIAVGLKNAVDSLGVSGLSVEYDSANPGFLVLKGDGAGAGVATAQDLTVTAQFRNAGSGDLGALATIDVSTEGGIDTALANIEGMIQSSISAAASFGTAGKRIEMQSDFLSKLTDTLKSGIGSLVDADMEEASARLQALQTQQQLGIQSLSIANQAPKNVLSLFRG